MIEFGALHRTSCYEYILFEHSVILSDARHLANMKQLPSWSNQETYYHSGQGEEGDKTTHGVNERVVSAVCRSKESDGYETFGGIKVLKKK